MKVLDPLLFYQWMFSAFMLITTSHKCYLTIFHHTICFITEKIAYSIQTRMNLAMPASADEISSWWCRPPLYIRKNGCLWNFFKKYIVHYKLSRRHNDVNCCEYLEMNVLPFWNFAISIWRVFLRNDFEFTVRESDAFYKHS